MRVYGIRDRPVKLHIVMYFQQCNLGKQACMAFGDVVLCVCVGLSFLIFPWNKCEALQVYNRHSWAGIFTEPSGGF